MGREVSWLSREYSFYKLISNPGACRRPFCRFNVIAFSGTFALPTIVRFFEKPQNARLIEFLRSRRCGTVVRLSLG